VDLFLSENVEVHVCDSRDYYYHLEYDWYRHAEGHNKKVEISFTKIAFKLDS
jgi:hypothetical protein